MRQLPSAETQLLADLVARRRQIVEMIGAERQRLKRATGQAAKSINRLLKALEKELASLDRDIDDNVRGSAAWAEAQDLLTSVPGVGRITARTLIAEMPELGNSIAARSQPSQDSPPGPDSQDNGAAKASSAAEDQSSDPPCSSLPWSQPASTQRYATKNHGGPLDQQDSRSTISSKWSPLPFQGRIKGLP